jgi:hypothetical protein
MRMGLVLVFVHEMFYPSFSTRAGGAAVAQIENETRIVRGQAAELGRWHARLAQKDFDLSDEHGDSFSALPRFALLERLCP